MAKGKSSSARALPGDTQRDAERGIQRDGPPARALVIGRRLGLEAALRRIDVPYLLWLAEPPKSVPKGVRVLVAPFASTREPVRRALEELEGESITHCIAALESCVVTASRARRVLGARTSPNSVARRCSDKLYMKRRLADAGVPVTDFVDLRGADRGRLEALGRPLVVKERRSSGSRGVWVVSDPDQLGEDILSRNLMAERFVAGEEMSVESFIDRGEIRWCNTTRYRTPKFVNVIPAGLEPERLQEVLDVNRRTIEALRIRWGMTHLELFLTPDGPVVGEIALRAPGGYLMRLIELAYGFDPWDALCAVELERPFAFPGTPARPTAAVILHPGPGRVHAVRGLEEVRAHPACIDARVKVQAGEPIPERVGIGVDVGRVLLGADTQDELEDAIRFVETRLMIELEPDPLAPEHDSGG